MEFFQSAITTLQTLVVALGAGLAVWGVINLLEGYDTWMFFKWVFKTFVAVTILSNLWPWT
jgi:uncharacterized membrane protein (DUF2068 family)